MLSLLFSLQEQWQYSPVQTQKKQKKNISTCQLSTDAVVPIIQQLDHVCQATKFQPRQLENIRLQIRPIKLKLFVEHI